MKSKAGSSLPSHAQLKSTLATLAGATVKNNDDIIYTTGSMRGIEAIIPSSGREQVDSLSNMPIKRPHFLPPLSPTEIINDPSTTQLYYKKQTNKQIPPFKGMSIRLSSVLPTSNINNPQSARESTQPTFRNTSNLVMEVPLRSRSITPPEFQFSFWAVVQMSKAIERMKTRYSYANLKSKHYSLIDDSAVDERLKHKQKERYRYNQPQTSTFRRILKVFYKALECPRRRSVSYCLVSIAERIPVFQPSNRLKLVWDFFVSICLLLIFFCVPLQIAVKERMEVLIGEPLLTMSMIGVVADIFVTLNTGYFAKGQIVVQRSMIYSNFLQDHFISDVIAIVPLIISIITQSTYSEFNVAVAAISLLFFVKVQDFQKILKKIEASIVLKPSTNNLVAVLKMLFVILFVAHLLSCVWIYEAFDQNSNTWYTSDKLDNNSWDPKWLDWYIKAYYYCTVTMVTVGYGDIYPVNNKERVLSVGTILLACCIFAYIVNSIGNIFQDFFRHSKEVKDNFYAINNYMEKKCISSGLQLKIQEYLSYFWDEERDNFSEKELRIVDQLSTSLKRELKIEANKIVLTESPVFNSNFSKMLTEKLCAVIQEQRCHPEQIIIKNNDEDDCNIYFIQKGKVEIYLTQISPEGVVSTKSCQTLERGQYFGSFSFFTGLARKENIRSVDFSQLLVVKRSDFLEILRNSDEDYQKFCMIKDQLIYNEHCTDIEQPCFSCNEIDHNFATCPIVHYAPKKRLVIKKYHSSATHHRRNPTVRKQLKFQTLRELEDTMQHGLQFLEQNESYLLDQDWVESGDDSSGNSFEYNNSFEDSVDFQNSRRVRDQLSILVTSNNASMQKDSSPPPHPQQLNNNSISNRIIQNSDRRLKVPATPLTQALIRSSDQLSDQPSFLQASERSIDSIKAHATRQALQKLVNAHPKSSHSIGAPAQSQTEVSNDLQAYQILAHSSKLNTLNQQGSPQCQRQDTFLPLQQIGNERRNTSITTNQIQSPPEQKRNAAMNMFISIKDIQQAQDHLYHFNRDNIGGETLQTEESPSRKSILTQAQFSRANLLSPEEIVETNEPNLMQTKSPIGRLRKLTISDDEESLELYPFSIANIMGNRTNPTKSMIGSTKAISSSISGVLVWENDNETDALESESINGKDQQNKGQNEVKTIEIPQYSPRFSGYKKSLDKLHSLDNNTENDNHAKTENKNFPPKLIIPELVITKSTDEKPAEVQRKSSRGPSFAAQQFQRSNNRGGSIIKIREDKRSKTLIPLTSRRNILEGSFPMLQPPTPLQIPRYHERKRNPSNFTEKTISPMVDIKKLRRGSNNYGISHNTLLQNKQIQQRFFGAQIGKTLSHIDSKDSSDLVSPSCENKYPKSQMVPGIVLSTAQQSDENLQQIGGSQDNFRMMFQQIITRLEEISMNKQIHHSALIQKHHQLAQHHSDSRGSMALLSGEMISSTTPRATGGLHLTGAKGNITSPFPINIPKGFTNAVLTSPPPIRSQFGLPFDALPKPRGGIYQQENEAFIAYIEDNFTEGVILDAFKNFSTYFPDHNVTKVIQEINKVSNEHLKRMKKLKLKKTKGTSQLKYSFCKALNVGNYCNIFKRRLISAKHQRFDNLRKQKQSEENHHISDEDEKSGERSLQSSDNVMSFADNSDKVYTKQKTSKISNFINQQIDISPEKQQQPQMQFITHSTSFATLKPIEVPFITSTNFTLKTSKFKEL